MKGQRSEGHVRDIVQSGEALVETERGLVFVRGALPGERVLISIDPKKGRIQRGCLLSVREPSSSRVEPACPYTSRCGGCPLMQAELPLQRAIKLRFLREALLKAGMQPELEVRETLTDHVLAYRRRARLAFRVTRGARSLGFRRERSHELTDIDACVVMAPALAATFAAVRELLLPLLEGEGEVSLALGNEERGVVVMHSAAPQPPALYAACQRLVDERRVAGIALFAAGVNKPATFGEPVERSLALDGAPLEGTIGGFSQAHAEINRKLVERVRELARPEGARVLELYAGHGNFTVALAPQAASYTAVEQDEAAVAALHRNLNARNLTAKVQAGQAEKHLAGPALDVVVLDPPRTGAPGVLAQLVARKPKRIVYVSCDPATLARDAREALERGYHIAWAEAFEMFPQTADLESVLLFERS